ncbi:MAG: hypothetical protein U5J62_01695 [Desulfurivibrio sp.]|nr:hypothetical protein [Desulfurivibrio sp.]
MQIHDPNLHQQLIEMCDCYLDTDFTAGMRETVAAGGDSQEDAVKYLALALLYALTQKAEKLSLKKKADEVKVVVKSGEAKEPLPSPGPALFTRITDMMRSILHSEADQEKSVLALGLRSGDVELQVKLKRQEGKESLKFKFPKS